MLHRIFSATFPEVTNRSAAGHWSRQPAARNAYRARSHLRSGGLEPSVASSFQISPKILRRVYGNRNRCSNHESCPEIRPGPALRSSSENPRAQSGQCSNQSEGLWCLPHDAMVVEGSWPGIPYPRVPGHEVAGIIDEVGKVCQSGGRVSVGGGLAWRVGRHVSRVPAGRLSQLPEFEDCRHQLRWRIPAIYAAPVEPACVNT